ncbi:MAG: hypothetical protein IT372_05280 [Polyangiaceae bacterium]|nr:hypothetical protein [Polyangiaceae bacterium]
MGVEVGAPRPRGREQHGAVVEPARRALAELGFPAPAGGWDAFDGFPAPSPPRP